MRFHRLVLVSGGSDVDRGLVFAVLSQLRPQPQVVLHGGHVGTDQWADAWARDRGVQVLAAPSITALGRGAPFLRDTCMVQIAYGLQTAHWSVFAVVFPGATATAKLVEASIPMADWESILWPRQEAI